MSDRKSVSILLVAAVLVSALGFGTVAGAQTWVELFPIGGPSGVILEHAAMNFGYDAANNRLIVYYPSNPGVRSGLSSEVWVLTNANGLGGTPVWIKLSPGGTPPDNINIGGSAVYDAANNRLIVYGGCFANCSPAQPTVYVLTNANGLGGAPMWSVSSVTNPQPRDFHSAVYDSTGNQMIAFGGGLAFFGTDQNDTRILTNANGLVSPSTWTTLSSSGGPPGIREEHRAVYDEANNRMTIFAGSNLITTCCPYVISDYNDAWVLLNANGQSGTPTWTQLSPPGSLPDPRSRHSAVFDSANNRMIAFGGIKWDQAAQNSMPLGDLWQLNNANGLGGVPTWTQLSPSGTSPGPNYGHAAAFDTANQRMIVFGGADASFTAHKRAWVLIFNEAPVAMCQSVIVSAGANCAANASINNFSFDPDGDTFTVTQSPPGPYPIGNTLVTLTVTDSKGASSQCVASVTVNNPNPTVTITGPPSGAIYPVGASVNFTGAFTDNPGAHTANWMIGSVTLAGMVDESTGQAPATHIFTAPGVYKVKLTVEDGCGGTGVATTVGGLDAMVVIYDPDGKFVTGGGWINSPAGAYPADPSLTGKANFGFVSKYMQGAAAPTGQTEFQFKAAGINFKSESYDWLVVADARAQYRGSGTINGSGNYGFLITAIDGHINGGPDKFRIKIWDKGTGDIIFDNQIGADDGATPITVLGGGSIVIHK